MVATRRPTEPPVTTLYPLWPTQLRAAELLALAGPPNPQPVEELLYGGEAGGGKSYLLRAVGTALAHLWPGATVALFRRTYPELEETHIRRIQAELPARAGVYNADRHEYRFRSGSILEFRYCEREQDVYRYQSAEWDALLVDEATHFSAFQTQYLRSRVRSTRPGWRPVIVYATNPGNVGHAYFRDGFVNAAPPGTVFAAPLDDGGLRRCFLRARLSDNPSLDAEYRRRLEGIADPHVRRALLEGDWDIFAGQAFSEFRRDLHTVRPFSIPPDWPRWRSVDGGWEHPAVCLWWTRSRENGRYYVYRELVQQHVIDQEQALAIVAASAGERTQATFADPALWSHRSDTGLSTADIYSRYGVTLVRGQNDRVQGKRRVHDLLALGDDGLPRLQIVDTCTALITSLTGMLVDEHDVEDCRKAPGDDPYDALRYGAPQPPAQAGLVSVGLGTPAPARSGQSAVAERVRLLAEAKRKAVAALEAER